MPVVITAVAFVVGPQDIVKEAVLQEDSHVKARTLSMEVSWQVVMGKEGRLGCV
jgi:hypothetical protein